MRPSANWLECSPLALTLLRLALAPVCIALAANEAPRFAFAIVLVLALLSDVFDGVLARRLGVATEALRRLDSQADKIFYIAVLVAIFVLHPAAIRDTWIPLMLVLVLESIRYVFDYLKFGREASYHMWSAKLWGIVLFIASIQILVRDTPSPWMFIAVAWGVATNLEGLAASLILPTWQHDVPSIVHAWRIRRRQLNENP